MANPATTEWGSEEDVKIHFLLPFLREKGYDDACFSFDLGIEIQEGRKVKTIFADVVIYATPEKVAPLVVCEAKAPDEVLDRFVKGQAISYARLLPRIAPIALITNGHQVQVFQTLNKNRIPELPHRSALHTDLVDFIVSKEVQDGLKAEAKHDLFIIDDVTTFKNVLKRCHNEIRNNEGYDPTVAFDEMSKVLFCKLYEEKENPANGRFRISAFDESLKRFRMNVIRQIFDETKASQQYSDLFNADDAINLEDRTLRSIVGLFENYDLSLTAFDVKGEAFEYFLSDTFTGGLGEYFTPRNIVEFMVEAIDPKIAEKVIDPFSGTGGFLIYAFEVVNEKIRMQEFSDEEKQRWREDLSNRSLYGTDWKERTSQACKMNMKVHGDGSAGVFMHHGLVDIAGVIEERAFDICLTNPPFGSSENDEGILARFELGAGRRSQSRVVLALERALRLVRPGGRIGIVVIDGILNNPSTRYVRDYIKRNAWVRGVISLDSSTFEGYGSRAKTSVLLLERKEQPDEGQQRPVFMAIAQNTGYAPNGSRIPGNELPIPGNELPDILIDYKAYARGEEWAEEPANAWVVDIEDRLDAEFYRRRQLAARYPNAPEVQADVAALLTEINAEFEEISARLDTAIAGQEFEAVRLDNIVEEVSHREALTPDKNYRLLGVRWWGEGTFVREEKRGAEIKAQSLFRVSRGWIIYNRLFAYRGSFAIVAEEHDGSYVSGEFPTFVVRPGVPLPDETSHYIVHCVNSPRYLEIIDALSTGSTKTSRNRLNQRQFLKMQIQVPVSTEGLIRVVGLLSRVRTLRSMQEELQKRIKELKTGIEMSLPLPDHQ